MATSEQDFLKTLDYGTPAPEAKPVEQPVPVAPEAKPVPGAPQDEDSFLKTLDYGEPVFKEDLALSEVPSIEPPEIKDPGKFANSVIDSQHMKRVMGIDVQPSALVNSPEHVDSKLLSGFKKTRALANDHYNHAVHTTQLDDLYHDLLDARENGKPTGAIEAKIAAMPQMAPPEKPVYPWEKAAAFTAGQVPIYADIIKEGVGTGIETGMLGATGAAIAGQAGPQAATPEEVVTVPAAFAAFYAAGQTYGSGKAIWKMMEGNSYREMLDAGVDEKYARTLARYGVGPVSAGLNILSFGMFKKMAPAAVRKFLGTVTDKTSKGLMKGRAAKLLKATGTEVLTEDLEEINQIVMTEVGINLTNELRKAKGLELIPGITRDEFVTRIKDVTEATLYATFTLGSATTVVSYGADKYMGVDSKRDEKENVIDMTANMMDKTDDQQREAVRDSGAIILGVSEDEEGNVTGMLMADRKTGETFETGPNPTPEEIYTQTGQIPKIDIDVDKVIETGDIESAFDVAQEDVADLESDAELTEIKKVWEPTRNIEDAAFLSADGEYLQFPGGEKVGHENIVNMMEGEDGSWEAFTAKYGAARVAFDPETNYAQITLTQPLSLKQKKQFLESIDNYTEVHIELLGGDSTPKKGIKSKAKISQYLDSLDPDKAEATRPDIDETAAFVEEMDAASPEEQEQLIERRHEDLRGKKVSEMTPEEKNEALGDKLVADMTEEEKNAALLKADVTEMPNRRAWNEHNATDPHQVQIAIDLDGLKFGNDFGGHPFGDSVLQDMAAESSKVISDAVRSYHFGGDEFVVTAKNQGVAKSALVNLLNATSGTIMKLEVDGYMFEYPLTFGFGTDVNGDFKNADSNLIRAKQAAKAKGEVADRGEPPVGISGRDPQGREMDSAEIAGFFERKKKEGERDTGEPAAPDVLAEEVMREVKPPEPLSNKDQLRSAVDKLITPEGRKNLGVEVVQSTTDLEEDLDYSVSIDNTVEGAFDPQTGKVYLVADNIAPDQAWAKLLHEGVHKVRAEKGWSGVLGKQADSILADIDKKINAGDLAWKTAENKAIRAKTPTEKMREETITYFMADNANKPTTLWKKIAKAIRTWAIKHGFKKKNITDEDIVALAEAAVRRAAGKRGISPQEAGMMFSKGQQFKPVDTNSPEFQKWFKDSKVVDADGKPLVVYHGTPENFDKFDIDDVYERAAYFTTNIETAEAFTYNHETDRLGSIVPVYLSLKNPKKIDASGINESQDPVAEIDREFSRAREEGHDGAILLGVKEFGGDSEQLVAFSPTQIKSAISNTGEFSDTDPRIMFSKKAEPFFSQLEQTISDKLPGKGTPESYKQTISSWAKKGEIKQEEVEWSGVLEWLDKQEGKLTKQDVSDSLAANNVRVEEVTKGEPSEEEIDTFLDDEMGEGQTREEAREFLRGEEGRPKFEAHQLPGGENYKELLLTLPDKATIIYTEDNVTPIKPHSEEVANQPELFWYFRTPDNVLQIPKSKHPTEQKALEYVIREKAGFAVEELAKTYTGGHFDEPNVLAHVRFNERVDAEGDKVLFIEEVQSDWHQAGRKKGYGDNEKAEIESLIKTQKEIGSKIKSERSWLDGFMAETREEMKRGNLSLNQTLDNHGLRERFDNYNELISESTQIRNDIDRLRSKQRQSVPDAPFKKTWPLLTIKRMVRYAAENGFGKIAWTTGEQQAERYDLSKQINMASAISNGDGSYNLIVEGKDGQEIDPYSRSGKKVSAAEMEDVVGKELTKKLTEGADSVKGTPWKKQKVNPEFYTVSGLDLKVGGEGMKGFYDKILPAAVNKFFKKFGAKVEETTIETGAADTAPEIGEFILSDGTYAVEYQGEQKEFDTEAEADAYVASLKGTEVHSLTITPEMRQVATEKGMPLFSKKMTEETKQKLRLRAETIKEIKTLAEQARAAKDAGDGKLARSLRLELVDLIGRAKSESASAHISTLSEKQKVQRRRSSINAIRDYFGLTDNDLKKISKKDVRLMSNYEFKKYKDEIQLKALEYADTRQAKLELLHTIHTLNLQKVDNFREALELPQIKDMTINQLQKFDDLLNQFHEGDSFLNKRQLETVDRTYLKGIRTWREAREKLAKDAGVPVEELDKVKVSGADNFKWDNALYESNPFYRVLVTRVNTALLDAQLKAHAIENDVFDLAKKAQKSVKRSLIDRAIPSDQQIFDYLEANKDNKEALAAQMTPEQLDLAHYMQEYFSQALTYLLETNSLNRGRENYFVHMRRTTLEAIREDGLIKGVTDMFKNYEQDQIGFNILDDNTGNILPLEKFFQFSLQRSGEMVPTRNIVRAFLTYANTFEKKVALDGIIPAMSIYAQSLTPTVYTPKGLEIDQSIKKFVNKYINNKKGRKISYDSVVRQGGKLDLIMSSTRMFVSALKLGFSPIAQTAAPVGEQSANLIMMGVANQAKGTARMATKKGKAITEKYEAVIGRTLAETLTAPGQEVTDRLMSMMFAGFHVGTKVANAQYLLGMITDQEFESGTISTKRLAELQLEKGRFRAVEGSSSLIGSTAPGKIGTQFKSWAIPVIRTTIKDLAKATKDLKNKPFGQKMVSKESAELLRITATTGMILAIYGIYQADEDDDSLLSKMINRVLSEASLIYSAFDVRWMLFTTPPAIKWAQDLGMILADLLQLVEYKDGSGLRGPKRLVQHFTPGVIKSTRQKKKKAKY